MLQSACSRHGAYVMILILFCFVSVYCRSEGRTFHHRTCHVSVVFKRTFTPGVSRRIIHLANSTSTMFLNVLDVHVHVPWFASFCLIVLLCKHCLRCLLVLARFVCVIGLPCHFCDFLFIDYLVSYRRIMFISFSPGSFVVLCRLSVLLKINNLFKIHPCLFVGSYSYRFGPEPDIL